MGKLSANLLLKDALFSHSNDYKFDSLLPLTGYESEILPSLSITIPYFETGEVINLTLKHLYNSINNVKKNHLNWNYEVILIDDGSTKRKALEYVNLNGFPNLKILTNRKNLGRTSTRNKGLKESKNDLCLFIDSDILIDNQLILNHLKTHSLNSKTNNKSCITVSFFRYTNQDDPILNDKFIYPSRIMINDWRMYCLYQATWIGCEEDKKYIGEEIRIVQDTNYFKSWKGMYKAWALSNMVLGGFFMVDRKDALSVGGFNESFMGYGFTETSLATKLIAIKNNYVIPILVGGGVHVEDAKTNLSQKEKDKIFKEKHDYYFNTYLNTPINKVIKGGI